MTPEEADACRELQAREPIYHHPELGTTREDFDAQTDAAFWEVGASGNVYSREDIWDTLETRRADPDYEDVWAATNFHCRGLGAGFFLVTYLLQQGERITRRSTIWCKTQTGWRAVYHQGTIVDSGS